MVEMWIYDQVLEENRELQARLSMLEAFIERWLREASNILIPASYSTPAASEKPCQHENIDIIEGLGDFRCLDCGVVLEFADGSAPRVVE